MSDWLAHRAAISPGREAIEAGGVSLTYAELDRRVDRVAAGLSERGVGAGQNVALLCWNSLELVEAVHALWRLGAVAVPLNARLTAPELAWQLRDVDATMLLCHERTREAAEASAAEAELGAPIVMPIGTGGPFGRVTGRSADSVACIMYTSGTTGAPKGAQLTFGNFFASAAGSAFNLGVQPGDRWLACMPLFHVGGLSIAIRSVLYGTSVVVHEAFDEARVAEELLSGRIRLVSVVATMLERVLDADPRDAPSELRVVLVGGGPVPPALLERAMARGFPVVQTYGLTETASQVTTLAPAEAASHLGSAGKPLMTSDLRVAAPVGEPGEILVGGPVVTAGYYGRPEATAAAFHDGWFHTGDIGRVDEDGYLFVLDRRDDLIVSGGENVYPAEVEAALNAHAAVAGAAVVGLADPTWGQTVTAAVVLATPATKAELQEFVRGRLASYKVPRAVHFVEELPLTASGKVRRGAVRELLAGSG